RNCSRCSHMLFATSGETCLENNCISSVRCSRSLFDTYAVATEAELTHARAGGTNGTHHPRTSPKNEMPPSVMRPIPSSDENRQGERTNTPPTTPRMLHKIIQSISYPSDAV